MEEKAGSSRDGAAMIQVGGLQGGRVSLDTVLLSVKEESDVLGAEEEIFRGVLWNDTVLIVQLHVKDLDLNSAPV